jgi:hypothetical protein
MRILAVLALCLLCSCYSWEARYRLALSAVEQPRTTSAREVGAVTHPSTDSSAFEDSILTIRAAATAWGMAFILKNKTDYPLRVVWGDAAIVDPSSRSTPVYHRGLTRQDCARPKASIIVPRGSEVADFAVSCDASILPTEFADEPDRAGLRQLINKTVRLFLPIEVHGTTNDYVLHFVIKDVRLGTTAGQVQDLLPGRKSP